MRVWNVGPGSLSGQAAGSLVNTLTGHTETIWALEWVSTHSLLASGSGDGTIRFWPVSVLAASQTCSASGVQVCCDGDGLGCSGKYAVSWRDVGMPDRFQVHALNWLNVNQRLASSWGDTTIRLWKYNGAASNPLFVPDGAAYTSTDRIYSLAWLRVPALLASASPDDPLPKVWKLSSQAPVRVLNPGYSDEDYRGCELGVSHCDGVRAVAASATGDRLSTASIDNKVKVWNPLTGAHLHTLQGHSNAVNALESLDSEARLASAGADGKINIWDIAAGTLHTAVTGAHTGEIGALAWIPTIGMLASGGHDMAVRIWKCVAR